jgi:hypothetical protein
LKIKKVQVAKWGTPTEKNISKKYIEVDKIDHRSVRGLPRQSSHPSRSLMAISVRQVKTSGLVFVEEIAEVNFNTT